MYILFGLLITLSGAFFVWYYFTIKDNKQKYESESNAYPIYHWRFFFKRYLIGYVLMLIMILLTLGPAMIIFAVWL